MSYFCPYCTKTFESSTWITYHVKKKHAAQVRLRIQESKLERLQLNIIAHKITKIPESFNIPSEYLGAFNAIG